MNDQNAIDRPILFSDQMVRAILGGLKTQTRRRVNNALRCRYGERGDRLWVREAWRVGAWNQDRGQVAVDYRADGFARREWLQPPDDHDGEIFNRLWQQSTDDAIKAYGDLDTYTWEPGTSPCRWRPSIHMPRWASRITMAITDVRMESLQDISEADARAEGAPATDGVPLREGALPTEGIYRSGFQALWDSINGPGAWISNPRVWVISFSLVAATHGGG